jgi:RND family efflux transporter MFP subunit
LLLPFALLTALVTGGCEQKSAVLTSAKQERQISVVAPAAFYENWQDKISAVGTTRAKYSVSIFPESDGVVTNLFFTPDQLVRKGDVLITLDDRDETLALELAHVQLADAKRLVDRYVTLNKQNQNLPESTVDEARLAYESAKIAVKTAELALERRRVRAPFDGHIGISDIDIGDRIDTATVVATLDDRSELLVDFAVPESFIGQVRPGVSVRAKRWESDAPAMTGSIIATDSRVNPATRAFTARAVIDNAADKLRAGMAFEVSVEVSKGQYLAVPDVAVQWGADGAYVWQAVDGRASRVPVQLIQRLEGRLLIDGSLKEGALIVAEGVQSVRQGVALRLLDGAALDEDARKILATPAEPKEGASNGY